MEDKIINQIYPLSVAVCIIRGLVEELRRRRFQSSSWHGMACSPAPPNKCWLLVVSFCQFQGATGAEAPSHGCRAARLFCALV